LLESFGKHRKIFAGFLVLIEEGIDFSLECPETFTLLPLLLLSPSISLGPLLERRHFLGNLLLNHIDKRLRINASL
jgi:hypothetical protein